MKIMIFLLLSNFAYGSLENCFKDAESHGSNLHPITPEGSCIELIKNHPQRIERTTGDGSIKILALKKMFYADQFENGKFIKRKLMAGEQPGFKNILDITLNEKKKKIVVLEKDSISFFGFDLIGNVAPTSKYISPYISSAIKAILLDQEDVLAIFTMSGFRLVNADAESRYETPNSKPRIIFEFKEDELRFSEIKSALYLKDKNMVVVLNGNTVFAFIKNRPTQTFKIDSAKSLKVEKGEILVIKTSEEILKIPIVY